MINVEHLSKSFGGHTLFEEVGFRLNPRERLGVVGRNGHGKTTLFKLIAGEEPSDSGSISIPKNYRISYVHQELNFTQETALKECMTGLGEEEQDHYWKVEKILAGLGFSQEDFKRHPAEFSGGFQVRLNLAKALAADPDLLLLDEPTNYLDITSIRWIERFLINWPHEVMLITHNRSFMDNLVTHIIGINRRKLRKIAGDTEKYYNQIAQEEEIYEKTRLKDERRRKEIRQFITRFRAKARLANMVQSRIKTLAKTEKKEKLEKIKTLDFSFRYSPFPAKRVLNTENLSFSYDSKNMVIKNFDIMVNAGDRVCVVGKNGKGKTTLLKLLAEELNPQSGVVSYNPNVKKGFFEQTNVSTLVDTRTVEEEILYSAAHVDRQLARNVCGAMMFGGNDALKKISVLSGGEKSRVMLGKLLVRPVNLLLLDEPTNHLDMESSDALLAAIDNFPGTVIMVTHNEMFLHALAQRLIVFQQDRTYVFDGSYQRFLQEVGWEGEVENRPRKSSTEKKPHSKFNKKELRRRRSEINFQRGKALKPLKQRIVSIENNIDMHEKKLNKLNEKMLKASQQQDGLRIAELSRLLHDCRMTIDSLFDELETVTDQFDEQNALFEKKLRQLDFELLP
ncbi:MAG: ABC-F family ATP-binding cassette domain-containing protein [Thermodesulfobacteriota bacterium]|nr:ABC-F family ATP-binding cassette domain-containing protein [Thermodesulfobacteriota bacterium]